MFIAYQADLFFDPGMRRIVFVVLMWTVCGLRLAAADAFTFDAPKNWRSERIPFPLGFAKELEYTGFEELRFGPGMFKPGSPTYWTYVYFWWLKGDVDLDEKALERDLRNYYVGLSKSVGRSRGVQVDPAKIDVKIQLVKSSDKPASAPKWTGTITTYDVFVTGKLLKLNVEISRRSFEKQNRSWYFFSVSPLSGDKPEWSQMRKIRDSFRLKE